MFLFKKKKIYKVVWSYCLGSRPYTDLVKAYDVEDAWRRICKKHYTITLISVEEV